MKRSVLCLAMLVALAVLAQACQGDFATMGQAKRLTVTVTQGAAGTPGQRLPLSIVQPTSFTVTVEAQLPDGSVDTSFNGYVNIFSQPGTVSGLSVGNVDLQGNVQLQNGTITGVVVPIVAAFGETLSPAFANTKPADRQARLTTSPCRGIGTPSISTAKALGTGSRSPSCSKIFWRMASPKPSTTLG